MITIFSSPTCQPEREYICHVLFKEFLGLEYRITFSDQHFWTIQESNGYALILPDHLFQVPQNKWLTPDSLPSQPLQIWDTSAAGIHCPLVSPKIPIIYGDLEFPSKFPFLNPKPEKHYILPIDILGSAFFMLTRYEEVVKTDRDEHGRFPATASLAFQEGFLDRPIVNEYLEILWFYLKKITKNEKRKTKKFAVIPTHDVDVPYRYRFVPPWKIAKTLAGDLVKRKSPRLFCENVWNIVTSKKDPYDNFDLIMDISERAGLASSFYFMAGGKTRFDSPYPLDHPALQDIIQSIHDRGHHVGFHPSYAAGLDKRIWKEEMSTLRRAAGDIPLVGGREHYLRFKTPETWRYWAESEMPYDSTLSFADMAGFRCGVCYPFPVFDVEKRQLLDLMERPLIMMECTVIDERYMNLGATEAAEKYMQVLKERCMIFNGEYVVLWHNTRFVDDEEIGLYKELIEA
ncbi:polysaccharide deacetylase family protein [Desulfoplanes formicivorans]|uniref:DUF7033 domain-containing protein n=1 Tax=Desulfoplanes formicivorans TaxID=1592317 RepID=A0A194AE60_9BACT|nr:polysaccharide deacetylase family protein [Desulfoplanes formicivorans]GAU07618.1 hypothetical protein DPF_0308 [Desulfoplanes formicivorans]